MPICPNCGNQAADNAIFCDQCGTRLPVAEAVVAEETVIEAPAGGVPEGVLICPNCGAENVPGEVFCDQCGSPLEAPEPVVEEIVAEAIVEAEPVAEVEEAVEPIVEAEPVVEAQPIEEAESVVEEAPVAPPLQEGIGQNLYCPVCGAEIHAGDTFCGNCGAALRVVAAEQVVPIAPVVEEVEAEEEPGAEAVIEEEALAEEPAAEAAVEETVIEEEPVEEVIVEEVIEEEPVEEVIAEEVPVEAEVVAEEVVEAEPLEEELVCPVCGARVIAGQVFCASCGAALQPAEEGVAETVTQAAPVTEAAPVTQAAPAPVPGPVGITGPYLEVTYTGAHIPLVDQPEVLIGREDEVSGVHPDVDMTPHGGVEGGVSRRHARLVHEGNDWFIVDLDSTNGTYVNGTELQPRTRTPVHDGSRIGLGDVEVVFHAP
jgi:predicted amidophosphoribosyltransferase